MLPAPQVISGHTVGNRPTKPAAVSCPCSRQRLSSLLALAAVCAASSSPDCTQLLLNVCGGLPTSTSRITDLPRTDSDTVVLLKCVLFSLSNSRVLVSVSAATNLSETDHDTTQDTSYNSTHFKKHKNCPRPKQKATLTSTYSSFVASYFSISPHFQIEAQKKDFCRSACITG